VGMKSAAEYSSGAAPDVGVTYPPPPALSG